MPSARPVHSVIRRRDVWFTYSLQGSQRFPRPVVDDQLVCGEVFLTKNPYWKNIERNSGSLQNY